MSQLQEVILDMLPTDSRQAIPAKDLPITDKSLEHIRTCLNKLLRAGMVGRGPKRFPKMGRVFVYWKV